MVQHIATLPADAGVSADGPVSVMQYLRILRRACGSGPSWHPVRHRTGDLLPGLRSNTYTTGANVNVDGGSNFFA
jgi:hypothetical protein